MQKMTTLFVIVFMAMTHFIAITEANTMQPTPYTLTLKQQNIALIAALTAKGNLSALKPALSKGLEAGLTINEIKEVLVQMYAYAGFPRSLNGINTFMAVLDERKAQGIKDPQGHTASPITAQGTKYERGKAILESLTGVRPDPGKSTGVGAISPEIETFLKEHLFADIFERDVLNYTDRELATIAALASLGGVEPMLQAHIGMGLNAGLTEPQIKQIMGIIADAIGENEAHTGLTILTKVMANHK